MVKTVTAMESSSRPPEIPPAIQYRLSDDTFLLLGWTKKPNLSLGLPVVTMKAKFAHPVISPWFQPRNENVTGKYRNGKTAYFAEENGTGRIYYPTGRLAAKILKGGPKKQSTRVWVYDSGEMDLDGKRHPCQLCAIFDSLGNGVVYDCYMRKRLVYNQTDGIIIDSPIKIPVAWKWHDLMFTGSMSVADDDDKSSVSVDKQKEVSIISPNITSVRTENNTEGLNTTKSSKSTLKTVTNVTKPESDFVGSSDAFKYVDTRKLWPLKVSPIKPIVFRINKYFSLRIFSQSQISLSFFAENQHTELKLGVLYNPYDKLKVTEVDDPLVVFERVVCPFESFPEKTGSMLKFTKFLREKRLNAPLLLSI